MCVSCQVNKTVSEVTVVTCGHQYCGECLRALFEASFTDESLFPPRCCRQNISVNNITSFLDVTLISQYEAKSIEFSTPNRTYCSLQTCSAFIRPDQITANVGTCRSCETRTCTTCKGAAHTGDCPDDPALQETLALAQREGWRRCGSCQRMVELDTGCNHMT